MTIVTCLADFDQLLTLARKHGVTQLRVDGIEAVLGLPPDLKPERERTTEAEIPKNIDAEAYSAYKNL